MASPSLSGCSPATVAPLSMSPFRPWFVIHQRPSENVNRACSLDTVGTSGSISSTAPRPARAPEILVSATEEPVTSRSTGTGGRLGSIIVVMPAAAVSPRPDSFPARPHGHVQAGLPFAPGARGERAYPRMIARDARRPQAAHAHRDESRDDHQQHGGGDDRTRHDLRHHPARRDAGRDSPALAASLPQRSAPRPALRRTASRHRAPSLTCRHTSDRLIPQAPVTEDAVRRPASQRIAASFQTSGIWGSPLGG